jgi:hypothetical protein
MKEGNRKDGDNDIEYHTNANDQTQQHQLDVTKYIMVSLLFPFFLVVFLFRIGCLLRLLQAFAPNPTPLAL